MKISSLCPEQAVIEIADCIESLAEKFGKHQTKLDFFICESEKQEQQRRSKAGTPEQDSAESTGPPKKKGKQMGEEEK